MATKSGARIYRGQRRRLAQDACPTCHRVVTLTPKSKRRRAHRDKDGSLCTGSGTPVGDVVVLIDKLPPIKHAHLNPRSQPVTRRNSSAGRDKGWGREHSQKCPDCGRWTKTRKDGSFVKHRIEADNPFAAKCEPS